MGETAGDVLRGACCAYCGVYFEEDHGYPVLCKYCAKGLNEKDMVRLGYQIAVHNVMTTEVAKWK